MLLYKIIDLCALKSATIIGYDPSRDAKFIYNMVLKELKDMVGFNFYQSYHLCLIWEIIYHY